ncbi:serine hydrolase [Desulfonatronum sp. SC1]|uniref:serine hydrolase domain-containing protein n=1 Tax=Desulfonatronum sp. SC1 TaxID=2109626 RepID=UPI000D31FE1F|nr:serine hydrolase domain-containing protein [Desulfonatronum sp. SC1]PTN36004.1 serine hydrolase [Desulfonatronum sp. SC1]
MKRMKRFAAFVFIFCLLFAPQGAAAESDAYSETMRTAREILWKTITSGGGSSATVAVMDGGKIVYSEEFGAAKRATSRPVKADTRFNIGSTSKMFAAVAILLLADDGKLALDDPVVKHLPEFVMRDERYRDITVRMLFNHSSGLPGSTFVFEYEPMIEPHALLLEVLQESDLKHAPGAMGIYCNDGFTLAEMIVERLSGMKFIDFVAERIFEPLGMKDSAASVGETLGNVAFYYDIPAGRKYPLEIVRVHAAGGLSSTAKDLCRFADSFTAGGKHILSEPSLEEVLKSQPTLFTEHLRGAALLDAFGWDYAWIPDYRDKGVQVLGKSGGTMFYSTNFQVVPAERLVVAVSISGKTNAPEISRAILDALMKEKGLPVPEKSPLKKSVEPRPIPSELLAFEGMYTDGTRAVRFLFDREKYALNIHHVLPAAPDGEETPPPLKLVHNEGLFHDLEKGSSYYFISEGKDVYLIARKIPGFGMNTPVFQRLEEVEAPKQLSIDMNGVLWMMHNVTPSAQIMSGMLMSWSSVSDELPGYVYGFGIQKVEGPDFASMAATGFRDQLSLRLFRKDGKIRVRSGMFVFSQASEAGALVNGKNGVVIGPDGENEWRKVEQEMILSFTRPEMGRVVAVAPANDAELLYDSVVDNGEFFAPEGTFVFLAGAPGDVFEIEAR